jgi:type VII secretion-associated serine protease mycosin
LSIALCLVAAPALVTAPAITGTNRAAAAVSATGGSSGLPNPTGRCTPVTPGQPDPGTQNVSFFKPTTGTPWAQTTLSYPSVWRLTEGGGVTVALIDSGVDANPQLNGRIEVRRNFASAPSGPADGDCVGHGTMAAGLIAASSQNGGLGGMAPQATILSLKITNTDVITNVNVVAKAINAAVADHVQVINMSLASTSGSPALAAAVQNAISNNIVVVAAAGNDGPDPANPKTTDTGPFYPAAYPGVLSVGAVDQNGALASFSDQKTPVGVTAPGDNITSTYPGTNGDSYANSQGTSFAAPLVAGLAALVRARYPQLSVAQVVQRIEETADGNEGPGTGYGLINPVQALTAAVIPAENRSQSTAVTINRPAANGTQKTVTLALTGGAIAIVVIVLAAAVVIPAGRRRRWRPGDLP